MGLAAAVDGGDRARSMDEDMVARMKERRESMEARREEMVADLYQIIIALQ